MKAIISLAIFLMATLTAWADSAKDRWTVYQSYSNITEIEPAGTVCFVLASNSVFSYDTTDGLVQTYDKAGVMSDVGVSHIAWAKASKRLVVVYTNSNIDLLSANGDVINAPDFYLKTTTLDKTINHIDFDGPYAYLSTAFGVVKLNTRDGAIMDTHDLGTNVSYTYVKNGYLYAESKERGRLRCKLTDNLLDKSNWVREDGFTTLREDRTNVQDAQTKLWWTKTADGKLDSYVGKKIKMGIRPEDIDDEPEFMAKHTDCQLDAQVDVSEMMGAEIYLYLEYKGNKMTARVAPTSKARNGDTVRVAFDPHKVHLFDIETEQTILN